MSHRRERLDAADSADQCHYCAAGSTDRAPGARRQYTSQSKAGPAVAVVVPSHRDARRAKGGARRAKGGHVAKLRSQRAWALRTRRPVGSHCPSTPGMGTCWRCEGALAAVGRQTRPGVGVAAAAQRVIAGRRSAAAVLATQRLRRVSTIARL